MAGVLNAREFYVPAQLGGCIGIAEILQLSGQITFINVSRLGPIEAHLQITTPKNNRLRFFGFALVGDLYLSTSVDTSGINAEAGKPQYNPYPLVSIIADLDWIVRSKKWPVKTYLLTSLCDNAAMLYNYTQIALKTGIELKLFANSFFIDAGIGLYKQKQKKISDTEKQWESYGWVAPGGRYRFWKRFTVLASLRCILFENQAQQTLFNPDRFSLSFCLIAPLIFKETNTEAIRTLVFMEKEKNKRKQVVQNNDTNAVNRTIPENTMSSESESDAETFDYKKEKDALTKQREEIEKKMEEIEQLLKEE
jgi:hypothetical protein